ncbi:hypothetical protein B7463_g11916, partial [Scytalidium lignicola]
MSQSRVVSPVLPEGAGYGVVVGIGFFFAILMSGISYLQNRYTSYNTKKSEEFNTASRNVKTGLIANAAGATVQIFMFAILACKVKQNAPRCHTFLEIINYRYGRTTHLVFIFFALLTNILVASQLLLGGSAVVTALTGMNVYAAVFLIPLGVCVYVVLGGLRATFLCDYTHTFIVMIIILYFMFNVYTTNPLIGSPGAMYDLLKLAATKRPVAGNQDGSYLTQKSNFGLIFGVIQLCSGMGTVFLDQGYWQRAIASRPTTAVKAYILGGMAWFAIPFGFATTLGLAAVALTDNPAYPTYPYNMTASQVSSGLSAPFGAVALLGKPGAIALLITLFMAVTSSSSSELIAVSSILTFDVYKVYVRPHATPEQLIKISHIMICVFGFIMACFACIWNAIGIDLGWLFLVMGLLIGGAVFPAAFAVTWKKQSKAGAIAGAIGGLCSGLTAWLVTAKVYYGEINVTTTGASYPTLAGNMAGVLVGLFLTLGISLIKPDNFDWEITRAINTATNSENGTLNDLSGSPPPEVQDKGKQENNQASVVDSEVSQIILEDSVALEDPKRLARAFKVALISATVLTFIMDFLIPIPMFLSHYIYSPGFFLGWVIISFMWVFLALGTCAILPIYEASGFFKDFFLAVRSETRANK